ncbi:MAG: OmpA family protein [Bacteroidota bacterium]|nr:OmpA family protein [Bacteroidota bacterium]
MKWKNINQYFLKLFTFALLILVSLSSYAQDEICDEPLSGNVKKLYEKGKNYKKYNYKQRVKFFKDALEIEEECIPCMWELAKMSFRRRYNLGESMDFPKKYFLQLSQLCPHYHADVFYYLSLIFYMEKNDCEAKNYFTQFLDFPTDDKKKIAINYTDQKSYVKASLEMSSYFCDFYTNPVPFNPRLISSVSTPDKNEVLPVISPDNEQLYFTCEYDEHIKGDVMVNHAQVFKMSTRENMKSNFTTPFSLIKPFNEGPKYGGATISLNNKEMFICACTPNGGYFNCDIFHTTNKKIVKSIVEDDIKFDTTMYEWTPLKNLGPNINGPQTWEGQPTLSADGKTLYFASARPGGYGKIDIYFSERKDDGTWSKAKNIGRPINTPDSDKSPFIHTDSKTLYFVSESTDDRWGAGDFDIFYTKQSKEGVWDKPINIGYPINSEGPEEALIVSLDGLFGYFSSQRKEGVGGKDIFYFDIPEDAKPEKVVLAKGKVDSDNPELLANAKLTMIDDSGEKKEQELNIDEEGDFVAVVNVENVKGDALLQLEGDETAFQSILISSEEISDGVLKDKDLSVKKVEKGESYTINDILYETNSSKIVSSSKKVLDAFAIWLKSNPDLNIEIQGHTDDVGAEESNQALSMDRAFSVMEYLLSCGISKDRMTFKGYGESMPKYSNYTDKGRAKNRRTDFLVF